MSVWCRVIAPSFYFCSFSCVIYVLSTLQVVLNFFLVFAFYICCFVIVIYLKLKFAVLPVSCENKSTTTHSTQFMVRTDERSLLYLYTKFQADSSIRSKVTIFRSKVTKFRNWVTWPRPRPLYGSFYDTYAGVVRPPSPYQIWSGQVNSFKSYKGGPKFSKLGHVTQATPT